MIKDKVQRVLVRPKTMEVGTNRNLVPVSRSEVRTILMNTFSNQNLLKQLKRGSKRSY